GRLFEDDEEALARTPAPTAEPARDVLRLQRFAGNQAVARVLTQARSHQIQRIPIAGVNVTKSGALPRGTHGGKNWHFNLSIPGAFHITNEMTREHYYFTAEPKLGPSGWSGVDIEDLNVSRLQ